ncbi:MAG: NFACT family protein [Methanomassiliicoccaceae archaeon]|nr:NFACT family protein [Methanomassiliicoccaceae archaeon]
MKKEMSSFDVRAIVNEMKILEGAHMDKIFHWGAANVLFRLNVQGQGKKELLFKNKKWLYMPESRPDTPVALTSFATFLRKYLDNARIGNVSQAGFDRIIVVELTKSGTEYQLIFEIFGGGNVLLISEGKIVNCLIHKSRRDRISRPGEEYVIPSSRFNPTSCAYEHFEQIMLGSTTDLVRALAMDANLGGQYAEEICKRTGLSKDIRSSELKKEDLERIFATLGEIVSSALSSAEAVMYIDGGSIADIAPIELSIYEEHEKETFNSMSAAIAGMIATVKENEEEDFVDPEIEKLQRRVDRQKETIDEYRMESVDLRSRADLIYANYEKVNELLTVLSVQSKKLGWDKLKEGTMKIPFVKSLDPSKNAVTADLNDMAVTMDYTKGIDANASDIYQKSKDINERAARAMTALKESEEILERKLKGFAKAKARALTRAQPTKQFWFEKYKWFVTSGGSLVIAGRDSRSNDQVVKKHMKERDVYVHADIHGAPSVIVKNGSAVGGGDLREACVFALAQSRGWAACIPGGNAFWVYPDQVSKTPQAGEFVPKGAFIIRGKRNYENNLPMQLAIGEITYENSRKIMCGPADAVAKLSKKYMIISPTKNKGTKKNAELAKQFNVPEEEIARIIPSGDLEITRTVWAEEE